MAEISKLGIDQGNVIIKSKQAATMRKEFCKSIVEAAVGFADVKKPRLYVKRLHGGYARYNPFTHSIVLCRELCTALDEEKLRALLGHEVGHALQRAEILSSGIKLLLPGSGFLIGFTLLGVWPAVYQMYVLTICFAAMGFASYVAWDRWALPRWNCLVQQREIEADEFADKFVGRSGVMAETRLRCAQLKP